MKNKGFSGGIPTIPGSDIAGAPRAPSVDLSQAKDVTCENCGNYTFVEVVMMKRLSDIQSPTGKAGNVPIPTFACNACGFVNSGFLPPFMRSEEKPATVGQGTSPIVI